MLYSSPPSKTRDAPDEKRRNRNERANDAVAADGGTDESTTDGALTTDAESPNELGASGVTDANWTGSVPADD